MTTLGDAARAARTCEPDPADPRSARAFARRLLRPRGTRAADAVACASRLRTEGAGDPQSVWEALAARGVIPAGWLDEGRRAFVAAGGALTATPPSTEAAVALASDPEGVAEAEALALEAAALLRPGAAPPRVMAWRLAPTAELLPRGVSVRAPP